MMYQCGRCGLTRASSQEPMGLVTPQCKCPFEFIPPVAPQRTWVGLALVAERVLKAWDDPQGMPALCEEMNCLREALAEPWVGLTDEERRACTQSPFSAENYLAIEAKLKEKNCGANT